MHAHVTILLKKFDFRRQLSKVVSACWADMFLNMFSVGLR